MIQIFKMEYMRHIDACSVVKRERERARERARERERERERERCSGFDSVKKREGAFTFSQLKPFLWKLCKQGNQALCAVPSSSPPQSDPAFCFG